VGLSVNGTLRSTWYDGLLGAAFLSRYHVIFDYARKRLILEPRTDAPAPTEFDMSGMFIVARAPAYREFDVREVAAGSPAHKAGIRADDVVITAEGREASTMNLDTLRGMLRDGDGRTVTVTLRRGDSTVVTRIVLRRQL